MGQSLKGQLLSHLKGVKLTQELLEVAFTYVVIVRNISQKNVADSVKTFHVRVFKQLFKNSCKVLILTYVLASIFNFFALKQSEIISVIFYNAIPNHLKVM